MEGQHVLVTGGTRGIGLAVVQKLAEAGAEVHVLSRSAGSEPLPTQRTRPWPCDLSDDADVWASLDTLQDLLGGPPDAVVNAAGAFALAPLAQTSVTDFDRNIAVNLRGAFLVIRALLPAMLKRGRGRVVNIGSVAGRRAFPGNGAYAASKFGLRGLHEVLVEELRGTGVEATLVEPAATDTSLWDPIDPDERDDLPDRADMLRPEDVADAVLFVLARPPGVHVPLVQIQRS